MKAFIFVLSFFSVSSQTCRGDGCSVENDFGTQASIQLVHLQDQEVKSEMKSNTAGELNRFVKSSRYAILTGITHSETAAKLNKYAASHPSVREVVPCSSLDVKGVNLLAEKLKPYIDHSMWQKFSQEDGRQFHIVPWKATEVVGLNSQFHRDALCAETMKLWSHHINADVKDSSMDIVLPTLPSLPTFDFENLGLDITELATQSRSLNKSLSCVAGHSAAAFNLGDDPYVYDWPHWPSIAHWRAKGHGPYPFWQFGPPESDWHLNESFQTPFLYGPGNDMEVWHSTPLKATKFYHSACRWEWLGFPELQMHACVGLMLNNVGPDGQWYVYTANPTTKATDEEFCCESTWNNFNGVSLGTINRKFVMGLMVGPSAVPARFAARCSAPQMHKPGGGGAPGAGKTAHVSRRNIAKIASWKISSAEEAQGMFTADNEAKLLKMNWKVRRYAAGKIKAKAAEFGVEVPAGFAAFDHRPRNAKPCFLKPSMAN